MIPSERSHLHVAAQSHPGMSGKNNEDRYAVSAYRLEGENALPVVLAIVSDGIGGHRAGEVAAEMAVETISQTIAASDGSQPVETLRQAVSLASRQIMLHSESNPEKSGMGATCACAYIIDDRLYAAYVGDSRIYLLREDTITQLSIDHTWIQEAIEAGILNPAQAQGHPNAHVIRRYLGSRQPVEPDTRLHFQAGESDEQAEANQGLRLQPGDQLVLCSDGLTDLVSADEILATMKAKDQQAALNKLIALANERGGHDNITITALQMPAKPPEAAPVVQSQARRQWTLALTCLTTSAILGVLVVVVGGAYLFLRGLAAATPSPTAANTELVTQPVIFPGETATPSIPPPLSPTLPVETHTSTSPAFTSTPWPTNTITTTSTMTPSATPTPTSPATPTETATATPTETATP
ncbi:MAG: serine/threonine-protein phosphatase [Anaerolineales bacterium]|nr:serine/threonine-protein phosphatase [Anaerolineales bacterium]